MELIQLSLEDITPQEEAKDPLRGLYKQNV